MDIQIVTYDLGFLNLSFQWLNDSEIKDLTDTQAFSKETQLSWFKSLKSKNDYLIWGIEVDTIAIGVCGLKNITQNDCEYWGYIGEKSYWGKGIGMVIMQKLEEIAKEYFNQAVRNKLNFRKIDEIKEKENAYLLIKNNRERFGRSIYMTFDNIMDMVNLWPTDFFGVYTIDENLIAAAIYYQFPNQIAFAVFWGDSEEGRPLRAMDFLSFNLWVHYRDTGFHKVDLGVSTENGCVPNEGLLRFKETHEAETELKFKLIWSPIQN